MSDSNNSFFDNVSTKITKSATDQKEKISNSVTKAENISNNNNLSASTKIVAGAFAAKEVYDSITKAIPNIVDAAIEAPILGIIGSLGLKGMACLPIAKQLDPVLGIDIHMVTIPPSPAPVPMPHPFIGILLNPRDFISIAAAVVVSEFKDPIVPVDSENPTEKEQHDMNIEAIKDITYSIIKSKYGLNATVFIDGKFPRAVAGTPTKNIPHFPMGVDFHKVYSRMVKKDNGHALLGSLVALADGAPISGGQAHLFNCCWDIGILSLHVANKNKKTGKRKKFGIELYLPTGIIIPLPTRNTILTNPIPAPFNPIAKIQQYVKSSFGRFFKKKLKNKKLADKLHSKVGGAGLGSRMLHKAICTVTGHPVDVATGNFFTDEEDFFLPGPVPLSWERTYYSKSDYEGPLGNGWHHAYDMAMHIDHDTNTVSVRLADGRPMAFELPTPEIPSFNLAEQLELFIDDNNKLYLWDIKEDLYYYFTDTTYNEVHLLQTVANKNGFAIQLAYNQKGFLEKITDSAHRVLTVENDNEGRILTINAPEPRYNLNFVIAQYEYDATGNLIKQTNANGDSMTFEYQGKLMITEVWRNGLTWHFRYDGTEPGARCIHTWGDGNIYNHKLAFEAGKTTVTNSRGHDTIYFHKGGLVTQRIDANGAEHFWNYNKHNQLLSETDPLGNAYLFAYDKRGNQTQATNPTGGTTTTEYNFWHKNKPNEVLDALGGKWKWSYDKQGNTTQVTNPKGAVTKIEYQNNLPSTIIDPLGNKTLLEYDDYYNLTQITEPTGAVTLYQYDKLGRNTTTQNHKKASQEIIYDLLGRATEVKDFDGNQIKLTYDGIDNLLEYQDKNTRVGYTYKGMWKMTGRYQNNKRTQFGYNTEEELVMIHTNDAPYQLQRDKVGNVIKETPFDQVERHYKYDLAGNVIEKIIDNYDVGGSKAKTQYAYNKLGNIETITYHDGVQHQFAYNPAGLLTQAINPTCEVKLDYDTMGNLVAETQNGHKITNTYNNLGQRTHLQSSLGANLNLEHNHLGQLVKMTTQSEQNPWEASFGYDQMGLEIQRLLPGQVQQTTTRDALGRPTEQLTGHASKRQRSRKYNWSTSNRLTQIIDTATGTTHFDYNKEGYLTQAKYADGSTTNRYPDAKGNLFESADLKDREYERGGKLVKKGSWHYKYNHQGFLTEKYKKTGSIFSFKEDQWFYDWNSAGLLEAVKRPDGFVVKFTYDALGRRLTKTYKQTTTNWVWDGNVPLHEWKGFVSKDALSENLITWIFEEDSFSPIAKLRGEKKYSILADHLGTPYESYDDKGDLVWSRELNANGKVLKETGIANFCPFLYQGQSLDNEIELAYNRFRYYDVEDGRYISQDPIGLASGEPNFYAYVEDSNFWIDPLGLKTYNGNDKRSKKKNHLYEIYNNKTGETYKFGISGGKKTKKNESIRANSQKNKIATAEGISENDISTRIVKDNMKRETALNQEQKAVNNFNSNNGSAPKYNLRPKPTN